jgi:hypothetical protein
MLSEIENIRDGKALKYPDQFSPAPGIPFSLSLSLSISPSFPSSLFSPAQSTLSSSQSSLPPKPILPLTPLPGTGEKAAKAVTNDVCGRFVLMKMLVDGASMNAITPVDFGPVVKDKVTALLATVPK